MDNYTFSFADGPSHISISGEKTGLAGQTIHLDCIVQSHPPPSITWYKVAAKSSQVKSKDLTCKKVFNKMLENSHTLL